MKVHALKIETRYLEAILEGIKRFEIRKDDRHFEEGDLVVFCEYNKYHYEPVHEKRTAIFRIGYIMKDNRFARDDYVIFQLEQVDLDSNGMIRI